MSKVIERLNGRFEVVPLEQILVSERYRQDYGNIEELALSLTQLGQLQNLVLCQNGEGYQLLAGGRRFAAMTKLGWTEANCLIFERSLSERELLEVEWEENSRRKSLTWQEDCSIKAKIHELRQAEQGTRISTSPDADGISIRSVASDLGISHATLSIDVALDKSLKTSPQMFEGIKTKKDAIRAMRTAGEVALRAELAKRMMERTDFTSDSSLNRVQALADRFIISDFFEGVKKVPDSSINFVEIDPPYAIELHRQKKGQQLGLSEYNEVIYGDYVDFLKNLFQECYRVMAPNSWLICWFAPDPWFEVIYTLLEAVGFSSTRLTAKWVKPLGQSHNPSKLLANASEEFFYAWKGEPSLAQAGRTNVFAYHGTPSAKKHHPTQRPLDLMLDILKTFCWEGDRIMIPFLGSGVTLLAAEQLRFSAFGYDLEQSYKDSFLFMASELFA